MLLAREGFGTLSNTPSDVLNPFKLAVSLPALLISLGLMLPAQTINVTEYPIPTPNSGAAAITVGPDEALWFTEKAGKIGRITTSGVITEYPVPTSSSPPHGPSGGLVAGPDGALWYTEFDYIGRISTTGAVTEYTSDALIALRNIAGTGIGNAYIAVGSDGALWFTNEGGAIGRITVGGAITLYAIPNFCSLAPRYEGITLGPDGAMWFIDLCSKAIGRITTAGAITEFPVPALDYGLGGNGIAAGPDGALWFGAGQSLGRITTTGLVTLYPTGGLYPDGITKGPDGAMWFTDGYSRSIIGRASMAGAVTTYRVPTYGPGYEPPGFQIVLGPDGALWYPESFSQNNVARFQIPGRTGVVSHIAAGGAWTTVITLVNTSSAAVPVTVTFHNDDGSALNLPVTTTNQGGTQAATTSSVSATISPNATLLITTGTLASTVVGWADVTSTGPVSGYAIFRTASSNSPVSEGTVPLSTQFPSTITLPYDNTAGFVMGVALANLSASTANVTATIWDDSGNQLGTQTITIAGNGHTSFVLPTYIALTAGKRGIVQFQSSGGIAGLGLRFSPFGTFTSVPTI